MATIDAPHWGGGTLETEAEMESYVIDKMFTITVLVALILAHTFLIRKNLSMVVIEKHMLAQQ